MTESVEPWTGTWREVRTPLATDDDLVGTIATRRDCTLESISEELDRIDDRFDVDAVYVERE